MSGMFSDDAFEGEEDPPTLQEDYELLREFLLQNMRKFVGVPNFRLMGLIVKQMEMYEQMFQDLNTHLLDDEKIAVELRDTFKGMDYYVAHNWQEELETWIKAHGYENYTYEGD